VNSLLGSFLPKAERPFGGYELVSKLATGGMAEIFLARKLLADGELPPASDAAGDEGHDLLVIKRVLPHLLEESRFIAMFRDEARLASQIIHPNVCRVVDSGTVAGTYFIAMEYLHGVPLSRVMLRAARTKKHLDVSLVVGLLIQCCEGLHHAHDLKSRDGRALEVVHRDVSPPNIFVTTDGLAKMLDFGVAKARGASQKTRTGTVKGKNSYMSPEQILGQEVDRRSDVFSLGIVLWEALTSRRLFSRETDFLTFTAITKAEFEDVREIRPDITDALAQVVAKALALDRDDRYSTAQELAEALSATQKEADGYALPEVIGAHVRARFSKELVPIGDLSKRISETFDAVADPGESEEEEVKSLALATPPKPAALTAPTQPEAPLLGVASRLADEGPITNTHDLMLVHASERRRLLMAVAAAVVVTALVAFLIVGGSGDSAKDAPPIDTVALVPVVATEVVDASVAVPPPDAAAAPDAQPIIAVPEVDNRPAYLTVDSSPYATIYVDGKKRGVTPIFKLKLTPGKHKLKAVSATGAKQSLRLNLKPGRTKNLGRLKW
jgi:serine/threonine protein kinase